MRRYVRLPLAFTTFAFLTVLIMGSGDCNQSWTRLDACTADFQCEEGCAEECGDLGVMFATCNHTQATCNPCICNEPGTGGSGGGGPGCICPGPDCVEFSDDRFDAADWDDSALYITGDNTYSAEQRSDDGNPAPYRFVAHTVGQDSSIWVAHEKPDASYEPGSEGAIQSIHYAFDGRALEGSRQASLKALAKQDGQWFWTTNLVLIDEDGWVTKTWTDDQLEPFSGGALNLEDGTSITFGFYTGASHTVGVPEVTRNTGVDNWRVVICTQPEIP